MEQNNPSIAFAATQIPERGAHTLFLSSMSHELRTPLNGIIGSINLLCQEEMLPAQQQHLNVLKYCSEHVLSLINDVLDFGKIGAGQMELSPAPFNLQSAIKKLHLIFERQFVERELNFVMDAGEGLDRTFIGDEMRLTQVLTNLLSNALKFTREGFVKCSVRVQSVTEKGARIRFAVQDSGIGISPEQQQYIFDAFRQAEAAITRSFGGTGLGLTISKKLVSLLGGDLQVESQSGEGSTFYFTLNLSFAMEQKQPITETQPAAMASLKGTRVLMADDNYVNRQITRRFLERWDVQMDEAVDGREALACFYKNKYDLLLIDLHMPEMDGYETIAAIRKIDPAIPALAFTAAVLPELRKKLRDGGFTDVLQKPFKPEDLHGKLAGLQPASGAGQLA